MFYSIQASEIMILKLSKSLSKPWNGRNDNRWTKRLHFAVPCRCFRLWIDTLFTAVSRDIISTRKKLQLFDCCTGDLKRWPVHAKWYASVLGYNRISKLKNWVSTCFDNSKWGKFPPTIRRKHNFETWKSRYKIKFRQRILHVYTRFQSVFRSV